MELLLTPTQKTALKTLFNKSVTQVLRYRDLKNRICLELTVEGRDLILPPDHALYPQVWRILQTT